MTSSALSAIIFGSPWLLVSLIGLPLIYFLVRAIPPAPQRKKFPALRLLQGLEQREETPARTPPWLLILRMVALALIILGLAGPLLNPADRLSGSGPVILVVDDGWGSAPHWDRIRSLWIAGAEAADQADRPVLLLTTAVRDPATELELQGPMPAQEAVALAERWRPVPWPVDRAAAAEALQAGAPEAPTDSRWLSDGLALPGDDDLVRALGRLGPVRLFQPTIPAGLLSPDPSDPEAIAATLRRATPIGPSTVPVTLRAGDGRTLAVAEATFEPGALVARARFDIPRGLANEGRSLTAEPIHAGTVALLDQGWRRLLVGIVGDPSESAQPLLSEAFYLTRAVERFADVRIDGIRALVADPEVTAIILLDQGEVPPAQSAILTDWVAEGGLLLRFAGPLLAASESGQPTLAGDPPPLVPVPLREGNRSLSGALSWSEPAPLAPFPEVSPLAGLMVPDDVVVERQVLARPELSSPDSHWARLQDGTPLITADRRGQGLLILVHTTADPRWSNLALSGLYVDVLERLLAQADRRGDVERAAAALAPQAVLNAVGETVGPGPMVASIQAPVFLDTVPSPRHPPGLYGRPDAPQAMNLGDRISDLQPLAAANPQVETLDAAGTASFDLGPPLLLLGLLLLLIDAMASLIVRGLMPRPGKRVRGLGVVCMTIGLGVTSIPQSEAQVLGGPQSPGDPLTMAAGLWLAHVETGDLLVDTNAAAGLQGLSRILWQRTAVEPNGVVSVNVERDELAFYPFLYWPISTRQQPLSAVAVDRLDTYMANGGVILFDTRDALTGGSAAITGAGPGTRHLRRLTADLAIPPLVPLGAEHVLTRSFYLLDDVPGRHSGDTLWTATPDLTLNDGVSPVLIGSHDWAAAWAVNDLGAPVVPMPGPNGLRQRELAYRFGVNFVMYALTGNYKADQVHIPAILERLGQ